MPTTKQKLKNLLITKKVPASLREQVLVNFEFFLETDLEEMNEILNSQDLEFLQKKQQEHRQKAEESFVKLKKAYKQLKALPKQNG